MITLTKETLLSYFRPGIQNLQREFSQKVPADQTASLPRLLHQKIHQEQLFCGKEPHNCQLPYHVRYIPEDETCSLDQQNHEVPVDDSNELLFIIY